MYDSIADKYTDVNPYSGANTPTNRDPNFCPHNGTDTTSYRGSDTSSDTVSNSSANTKLALAAASLSPLSWAICVR